MKSQLPSPNDPEVRRTDMKAMKQPVPGLVFPSSLTPFIASVNFPNTLESSTEWNKLCNSCVLIINACFKNILGY